MKHLWALLSVVVAGFLLSQANNLVAFVGTIAVFILVVLAIYRVRN